MQSLHVTSPARPVYTISAEFFYIPSTDRKRTYTVAHRGNQWRCECEAGKHGQRCWHSDLAVAGMVEPAWRTATPAKATDTRRPTAWQRERARLVASARTARPDAPVTADSLYF